MIYDLPKSLDVCGTSYAIRWDYRAALDVCAAFSDTELSPEERALAALIIFYPDFEQMPPEHYQEALQRALWFFNGGQEESPQAKKKPVLMSWEQDWPLIVGPVSRVVGRDIRGMELHWWSFLAAYMEIGDCLFAQVVGIRSKKKKGTKLDKTDRAFYRENQEIIDLKTRYTEEEEAFLRAWSGKTGGEA